MRQQTLSFSLKVPDSCYSLDFLRVYEGRFKFVAILELHCKNNANIAQMPTTASASINVTPKNSMYAKPVEYFVIADNPNVWYLHQWYLEIKDFRAISSLDSAALVTALQGTQRIAISESNKHESILPSYTK